MEHPSLASLREYLSHRPSDGVCAATMDHEGNPTPCLMTSVPRLCSIDTSPSPEAPRGIYGNAFATAPFSVVLNATTFLGTPRERPPEQQAGQAAEAPALQVQAPQWSNILALAAPSPGRGAYSMSQISAILTGAYSGFAAAKAMSEAMSQDGCVTRVHTGHWGCGAFGGNRRLMAILQVLAARMAGVSLVYHTVDQAGAEEVREGLRMLEAMETTGAQSLPGCPELRTSNIILDLQSRAFPWGQSDGN